MRAIDLDGFSVYIEPRALELTLSKNPLAIVHAAVSPDPSRSTLTRQDSWNRARGLKSNEDGWLNPRYRTVKRRIFAIPTPWPWRDEPPAHAAWRSAGHCAARPKQFQGDGRRRRERAQNGRGGLKPGTDRGSRDAGTGTETFEAIRSLRKAEPSKYHRKNGRAVSAAGSAKLQQSGQLLKANREWKFFLSIAAVGTTT